MIDVFVHKINSTRIKDQDKINNQQNINQIVSQQHTQASTSVKREVAPIELNY